MSKDIDKIVKQMPLISATKAVTLMNEYPDRAVYGYNMAIAQCQLLAEQGWRKIPPQGVLFTKIAQFGDEWIEKQGIDNIASATGAREYISLKLHQWLLERDAETKLD